MLLNSRLVACRVAFTVAIVFCLVFVTGACDRSEPRYPALPQPELDSVAPEIQQLLRTSQGRAEANSEDAAIVGEFGRALYAYSQFQGARECFNRSHQLDPESFEWVYLLAITESELGDYEAARSAMQNALELRPDDLPAVLRLADLQERAGHLDITRESLELCLRIDPSSAAVYYRLGRLDALEGLGTALGHLEKAVELDPDYREANYLLANMYLKAGRQEDADLYLMQYEQTNPSPRRHYADPLIDAISSIKTDSAQKYFEEGREWQRLGDLESAIVSYQSALEMDQDYVHAHVNLIAIHGQMGNLELATRHYERSLQLRPLIADAHYNYGISLQYAEDFKGAVEAYRKAVEINPQDSAAYGNLGVALERLGQESVAIRSYRQALEHDPLNDTANYHMAKWMTDNGKYREALPLLEVAVANSTDEKVLPVFLLALIHRQLGNKQSARTYSQLAQERATNSGQLELADQIADQMRR